MWLLALQMQAIPLLQHELIATDLKFDATRKQIQDFLFFLVGQQREVLLAAGGILEFEDLQALLRQQTLEMLVRIAGATEQTVSLPILLLREDISRRTRQFPFEDLLQRDADGAGNPNQVADRGGALAMGGTMSAFFIGYALMQIPGGMLADRFGPKQVMAGSLVCWSIFTALIGMASSLNTPLMLRILFGLSEGPFPPAASKTIVVWFPHGEVGRANGIQLAGINIGAVIAPLLVAPLIFTWGWRSVFYVLMLPGLVLAMIVWFRIKDAPPHQPPMIGSMSRSPPPPSLRHNC